MLYSFVSDAQIGDDEYNKYWNYRQRLITEFMVPGVEDHGCSASEMDIPNGYSLPS